MPRHNSHNACNLLILEIIDIAKILRNDTFVTNYLICLGMFEICNFFILISANLQNKKKKIIKAMEKAL